MQILLTAGTGSSSDPLVYQTDFDVLSSLNSVPSTPQVTYNSSVLYKSPLIIHFIHDKTFLVLIFPQITINAF